MRSQIAAMIIGTTLAGCAARPEFLELQPKKALVLEQALAGRVLGEGAFVNSLTGGETRFSVVMDGTWDGKVLKLVEDFTYADGTTDRISLFFDDLVKGEAAGALWLRGGDVLYVP